MKKPEMKLHEQRLWEMVLRFNSCRRIKLKEIARDLNELRVKLERIINPIN